MPERPMRADARRNREQVLRTAARVFASEGLAVPVHEIAQRAGVGTGTVSRHFPTKEDLFAAVLLEQMRQLANFADAQVAEKGPGEAFFALLVRLVQEGRSHRGLAEALAGTGFDFEAAATTAGCDISGRMRDLLRNAQDAGAVRPDVTHAHVKALIAGCLAYDGDDSDRVIDVVSRGLR